MAKTVKKEPKEKEKDPNLELKILKTKKQYRVLAGFLLVLLSIAFLVSFISFFVTGQADQSAVDSSTKLVGKIWRLSGRPICISWFWGCLVPFC